MAARLTREKSENGSERYTLSVPPRIARLISKDQKFSAELTEEGLLFRPVGGDPIPPSWVSGSRTVFQGLAPDGGPK